MRWGFSLVRVKYLKLHVCFLWFVVGHAVYGKKYDDGLWLDASEIPDWTSGECWMRFMGGT